MLEPLPSEVTLRTRLGPGQHDVILFFTPRRSELEMQFTRLKEALVANGSLWICWPKKASGVETDLTENVVRDIALANGLVDNRVCAVDDACSGLRLVYRLKDRT